MWGWRLTDTHGHMKIPDPFEVNRCPRPTQHFSQARPTTTCSSSRFEISVVDRWKKRNPERDLRVHGIGRPISRVLSPTSNDAGRSARRAIICLHPASPQGSSGLPDAQGRRAAPALMGFASAWPCSRWGLPGRRHCCRRRWSLTPPFHPDRLERRSSLRSSVQPGGLFLWPCPRVSPPGSCPASCSVERGLSSGSVRRPRSPDRPSHQFMIPFTNPNVNERREDLTLFI